MSDDEIKILWTGAGAMKAKFKVGDMLKLELVTGQRQGEVRQMEKTHVDLEAGLWTIPETVTKNGRIHVVPLPDLAVAILDPAIRRRRLAKTGFEQENPNLRKTIGKTRNAVYGLFSR